MEKEIIIKKTELEITLSLETTNRQWILKNRPVGYPKDSDFEINVNEIPEIKHDEILIKTLYMSLDPYMRGRLRDAKSYSAPVQIGEIITGEVVGRVIRSNYKSISTGDIVTSHIGWQEWGIAKGYSVRKITSKSAPISTSLGILGMPGLTAYFGLLKIGKPVPGDTLVISAASGAVGAVVGQIGKMSGCNVIGIAGSDEKINYITNDLGFDIGINYKTEDIEKKLSEYCSNGLDIYFDNVGGPITDAAINNIAVNGRVIVCGQISEYNDVDQASGPRNLWTLIRTRSKIQGMLVSDWADEKEEALSRLSSWVSDGKIKYKEDIREGFDNAPKTFIDLMNGKNFGKLLVHVSD